MGILHVSRALRYWADPGLRLGGGGAAPAWYRAGGAPTPVAAYQPIGAADLAASYINLANPGTNNAAPGVAPTWAAETGWTFNGTTQYLNTGVKQLAVTWTAIIRFADVVAEGQPIFGAVATGPARSLQIAPNNGSNLVYYGNGNSTVVTAAPGLTSGVLAIANKACYRNGVAEGTIAVGSNIASALDLWIAGTNVNGVLDGALACAVQAVAIYDVGLDADQVAAVTTAMQNLA